MKIFDAQGKLIHDLPRQRDVASSLGKQIRHGNENATGNTSCSVAFKATGWAKGNQFGVEDGDGNRVVFGTCSDVERARYQLKQVFRAYVDGAETYTVKEA